ncbi:MAG: outer membrane lipoprotein-sorting protein [Planctomycetota bacterium]
MLALVNKGLRATAGILLVPVAVVTLAQDVPESKEMTDSVDPSELLLSADTIRFPRDSFQTEITVINFRDEEIDETRVYRVLSKGNENTIVLTVEPASERGQALLMKGRNLWIYLPSVSQPVRLSLSQRLTGQVANGDLARANFAGDYDATLLRVDDYEGEAAIVLELTAAAKGVTYDRVHYWIDADDNRPLLAEFYARSGRLLKTMRYEEFKELAGAVRPTKLVIDDALKPGRRSVLSYTTMALRDLPEHIFTRDYLKRLQ